MVDGNAGVLPVDEAVGKMDAKQARTLVHSSTGVGRISSAEYQPADFRALPA